MKMLKRKELIYEIEIEDIQELFPKRKLNSHKGMFGTVGIIGGSMEYSGSVKLANMSAAAIRSGPGIVRVIVPEEIAPSIMPYLLEQTLYPIKKIFTSQQELEKELGYALKNLKAVAFGMGLGRQVWNKQILEFLLLNYQGTVVIDADGLNTLSEMNMDILKRTHNPVILTPHFKEFERLTHLSLTEIQKNPIKIARNFAQTYQVILLLKGSTTIITDGTKTYLSKRGCPGMATAGSGDVLAGVLIGMLGYLEPTLLTIAGASFLAGMAGELAQEKYTDIAMIASDTLHFLPEAIQKIRNDKGKK